LEKSIGNSRSLLALFQSSKALQATSWLKLASKSKVWTSSRIDHAPIFRRCSHWSTGALAVTASGQSASNAGGH
jgi:hypothetical protein